MQFTWEFLFQWSLVILGLLGLLYAAFTIKNEKKTFKDESYLIKFGQIQIPIPNWWTQETKSPTHLLFYRSDTRYAWEAHFHFIDEETALTQALENYVQKNKIVFDPDVLIETNSHHFIQNQALADSFTEAIRVEGTATQNVEDRMYIDLVLIRKNNEKGYFLFTSLSSVLNGSVEGPYFEEAIFCMEEDAV
jgi:hypothetical protein